MIRAAVLTTHQALNRYGTTFDLLENTGIPQSVTPAISVLTPLSGKLRKEEISNKLSFASIIKQAKADNEDNVLIFEDDISLPDGFNNTILEEVLEELPETFGLCYLGCYIRKGSSGKLIPRSEHLLELQQKKGKLPFILWGAHAVIINRSIYDKLIGLLEDSTTPVTDKVFYTSIVTEHRCFLLKPPLIFQRHCSGSDHVSMHGEFKFEEMENDTLRYIKKNTV